MANVGDGTLPEGSFFLPLCIIPRVPYGSEHELDELMIASHKRSFAEMKNDPSLSPCGVICAWWAC